MLSDDLATEARLIEQIDALTEDKALVDRAKLANQNLASILQQKQNQTLAVYNSVPSQVSVTESIPISLDFGFIKFTFSVSLSFTVSIDRSDLYRRYVDASNLYNGVVGSTAYTATTAAADNLDETNTSGLLATLKADLTDLQTRIFSQRNAYESALQDLSARYEVLKVLGNVILETVGTVTLDPDIAKNESASSLISEIQAYADTYLSVPRGMGESLDGEPTVAAGPTASSVIQTTVFKEFYDVTTLSGLASSRIHIADADIESLTIDLGSEGDTVDVHHTRFPVDLNTGGGTDIVRVGDAHASLDDIQGNLNIDAGGGSNVLVVDGSGDSIADPAVEITSDSVTGLAPAEIYYTATDGDFQSPFDPVTGSFAAGVTISAGSGEDQIRIENTLNDPGLIEVTQVEAGGGNDRIEIIESDQRYLVVNGQAGNDTIDAGATTTGVAVFGGADRDLILGGTGNDILVGGLGDDGDTDVSDGEIDGGIFGGIGDDVLVGDDAVIVRDAQYVVQRIETADESNGGADDLFGEAGNDVLIGGAGGDLLTADLAIGTGVPVGADIIVGDNGVVVRNDGSDQANDVFSRNN
ncbi:MAG: hypothetical protein JJ992_27545, partial [Planctomycetes bacterium]|nr:hypothetical protein [Planctomycetota bacterium]